MTFRLGKASEEHLLGVRTDLVCVVRRAIAITGQDFGVHEGVRSMARQRLLVASGASRTLESYHLTGEAVDLVPYVGGRLQWQMPLCLVVAEAMREASLALEVPLVWGGVWDRKLHELDAGRLRWEVSEYAKRWHAAHPHAKDDEGPLVDGPHFQRVRS